MPVSTQLVRDGEALQVGGWTWWHLNRLYEAMKAENPGQKVDFFPYTGSYIFKKRHIFTSPETDIWTNGTPGESFTFVIEPGDQYRAWR